MPVITCRAGAGIGNIFPFEPGIFQLPCIAELQIKVCTAIRPPFKDFCGKLRKGFPELAGNAFPHLIAAAANRGADGCQHIGRRLSSRLLIYTEAKQSEVAFERIVGKHAAHESRQAQRGGHTGRVGRQQS